MRRGTASDCARAAVGIIASRSGSARPTPAPRSIVRREMAFVFNMVISPLVVPEEIASNDPMNDVPDSVSGAAGLVENLLHGFAIREADGCAGSVGGKLADDVPRYRTLFVIEQEPFEFANVFEGAAIWEDAGGIHRQAVMESERLTGKADAGFGFHVLGEGAIPVAPAAHHVEAFECKSRRIDRTVAGVAEIGRAHV